MIKKRALALTYGLLAHGLFALGVAWMALALFDGLGSAGGRPAAGDWRALVLDAALVLQFPLLHSFLLAGPGRRVLARLAPRSASGTLATTLYATAAAAQLVLVFGLWRPSGVIWWRPEGALAVLWTGGYAAAWLLLLKAMWDAGLGIQLGYLGWTSLWRGSAPRYGPFPRAGLFRICRQPVYLAFALILWSGPVWTPDHLAIASGWSLYCYLGPRLKERRYRERFGPAFETYQAQVGYFLPRGSRPVR